MRTSYGLPCAHEHALYSSAGQSIPLDSIDRFWTKLDLSPCMSLEDDDIGCEEEIQKFTATFKKKSTSGKFSLLRKLKDIIAPSTSSVYKPVVHNTTRGCPSLKNQSKLKTIVDPPPQQPLTRSYSNSSTFRDFSDIKYQEPARHSSYFDKKI